MPSQFCPPSRNNSPQSRIKSYLEELLQLSPADLRPLQLTLQASLNSTTAGSSDYKIPKDQDAFIFSMQGFVRMPTLNTEPQTILGYLNLDPSERIYVKTQNCLVQLQNIDRSYTVMEENSLPLSAITPPYGSPLYYPVEAPLVLPAGHTFKATFTLQDSTAAIIGNASNYGISLMGILLPKRD